MGHLVCLSPKNTTRNFVFCNLSYATKKSHMQLFWSCMRHVQLHATFFSCIKQVAKDKISSSENYEIPHPSPSKNHIIIILK
jgi:hypothetical protein